MKKILWALLAIAVIGAGVGYYLYNKPLENMSSAKVDLAIDAAQLFNEFNADETAANAKYLDKTISVSGTVKEVTKEEDSVKILLDTGNDFNVVCALDALTQHPRTEFPVGEKVTFKGKCTGLNLDVQLERCVEVK